MDRSFPSTLSEENIPDVLQEIEQAYFDIPFDNSHYQTENFVIAAQITPERAYRAIGLRMSAKIRALQEAKFGRMKEDIDIEELQSKIDDENTSTFDKRRAQIDITQKMTNRTYTDKLINDALSELNVLYRHFKSLPKFTREQFEIAEHNHFTQRLTRQVQGLVGAHESLANISEDKISLLKYEEQYVEQLLLEQNQHDLLGE